MEIENRFEVICTASPRNALESISMNSSDQISKSETVESVT